MRSIHHHHHHSPPLSTLSNCLSRNAPPPSRVLQRHFPNHVKTKPMVVTSSHLVVLAASSPAAAGDISVLIPTRFPQYPLLVITFLACAFLHKLDIILKYMYLMHVND
ncbi:hypothetical protein Hanom_Chr03g00179111 [Helianthus anomalus]